MKSNKKSTKNASQITLSLLMDAERCMKEQRGTDEYFDMLKELNAELSLFIRLSHNLVDITTLELLEVCRMVGAYCPFALHAFFIYCSQALEGITENA